MAGIVAVFAAFALGLGLVNLLLAFAVIRRLRDLQMLIVPGSALPSLGSAVAPVPVDDDGGLAVQETALAADASLVIFLTPTCPACQQVVAELPSATKMASATLIFVVDDGAGAERLMAFRRDVAQHGTALTIPPNHSALSSYGGVAAFPTCLMVANGRVVAAGNSLKDIRRSSRASARHIAA